MQVKKILKAFLNGKSVTKPGLFNSPIDSKWIDQSAIDPRQGRASAVAIKREAYFKPSKRTYQRLRRNPASGELEPIDATGRAG